MKAMLLLLLYNPMLIPNADGIAYIPIKITRINKLLFQYFIKCKFWIYNKCYDYK